MHVRLFCAGQTRRRSCCATSFLTGSSSNSTGVEIEVHHVRALRPKMGCCGGWRWELRFIVVHFWSGWWWLVAANLCMSSLPLFDSNIASAVTRQGDPPLSHSAPLSISEVSHKPHRSRTKFSRSRSALLSSILPFISADAVSLLLPFFH